MSMYPTSSSIYSKSELIEAWRKAFRRLRNSDGEQFYIKRIEKMAHQEDYSIDLGIVQALAIEELQHWPATENVMNLLIKIVLGQTFLFPIAIEAAWATLEDLFVLWPALAVAHFNPFNWDQNANHNYKTVALLEAVEDVIGHFMPEEQRINYVTFRSNLRNRKDFHP